MSEWHWFTFLHISFTFGLIKDSWILMTVLAFKLLQNVVLDET